MRRIFAVATAVLMAAGAVPSFAQSTTEIPENAVDGSAVTRAENDLTSVNGAEEAAASEIEAADNTYGAAVAAVTGWGDVDLTSITDEGQVTIVPLTTLKNGSADDAAAFDTALAAHAMAKADVHAAVSGNNAIAAKLEAEGFDNDDVVAIRSKAEGSVTVYVDDRG